MTTNMSKLDPGQIAKKTYDDTHEAVKVVPVVAYDSGTDTVKVSGSVTVSGTVSTISEGLTVVDQLDTPLTLGTSLNGVAGALVTVVASLAAAVKKVHFMDTTGSYLGLYNNTTLIAVINPGSDSVIDLVIAAGSALKLRSMEAAAPTAGSIAINFIG
jgi:hypothetical protein